MPSRRRRACCVACLCSLANARRLRCSCPRKWAAIVGGCGSDSRGERVEGSLRVCACACVWCGVGTGCSCQRCGACCFGSGSCGARATHCDVKAVSRSSSPRPPPSRGVHRSAVGASPAPVARCRRLRAWCSSPHPGSLGRPQQSRRPRPQPRPASDSGPSSRRRRLWSPPPRTTAS